MHRRAAGLCLLPIVVLVLSCADTSNEPEVTIRLDEFSLDVEPGEEDEGTVRIFIDNEGDLEHTLVFVQATDPAQLPRTPDGGIDLAAVPRVADRLESIGPGRYTIKPDFLPGPLVVFCELVTPGPDGQPVSHFEQGMVGQLNIKRTTSASTQPPVGAEP